MDSRSFRRQHTPSLTGNEHCSTGRPPRGEKFFSLAGAGITFAPEFCQPSHIFSFGRSPFRWRYLDSQRGCSPAHLTRHPVHQPTQLNYICTCICYKKLTVGAPRTATYTLYWLINILITCGGGRMVVCHLRPSAESSGNRQV